MSDTQMTIPMEYEFPRPKVRQSDWSSKFAEDLHKWHGLRNEDIQDIKEWAKDAFLNSDGFKIAQDIKEEFMVSPDSELVEICENAWFYENEIREKKEKEWAKLCNIAPKIEINTTVKVKIRGKEKVGIVTRYLLDTAKYIVRVESDGQKNGTGYIFNFETVEKLNIDTIKT